MRKARLKSAREMVIVTQNRAREKLHCTYDQSKSSAWEEKGSTGLFSLKRLLYSHTVIRETTEATLCAFLNNRFYEQYSLFFTPLFGPLFQDMTSYISATWQTFCRPKIFV